MSNLLNKASIITTPTGYDTGYLLSIKPSVSFGSELISETTDNISGWTEARNESTLSIVDNNIRSTRTDSGAETIGVSSTAFTTVVGKKYRIKVNATRNNTNGSIYVRVSDVPSVNGAYFSQQNNTNAISVDINFVATATTAYVGILATSQDTGDYLQSNLMSIKEDVGADLEFSRASTATRINALQTIENVSINVPRINYTGGVGHILLEPQSTNLIPYSSDFSNNAWSKSRVSVGSQVLSPSGSNDAYEIIENADGGYHRFVDGPAVIAGEVYTISIFAKKNTRSFFNITMHSSPFGNNAYANYNLNNGTVHYTASSATSKIEDYGNGWYRCSLTVTANSNFGNANAEITLSNQASSARIPSYQGDGVSGMYFWGCHYEEQSFPTSYIPTSGSTVTRLGETLTNSGNADLFNDSEGVLYAEVSANVDGGHRIISISDGGTANRIMINTLGGNNNYIRGQVRASGITDFQFDFNSGDITQFHKVAIKYKQNDFAMWVDGVEVATDTSGNAPISLDKLNFNQAFTGNEFYGKTKCVAVFREALTDAQLQCLTS